MPVFAGSVATVPAPATAVAFNSVLPDVAPASDRSFVANVTTVPLVVAPAIPPNEPAALYCNCVEEPPGVPPPPEPQAAAFFTTLLEASRPRQATWVPTAAPG